MFLFPFLLSIFLTLNQHLDSVEKEPLLEILANRDRSSVEDRQEAFEILLSSLSNKEPHYIPYCAPEKIDLVRELPASLYAEIIQSMPICCVDVFVFHFEKEAYLMMERSAPPEKGKWWTPGGRVFKGESFYEAAVRKTKRECGLDVYPVA